MEPPPSRAFTSNRAWVSAIAALVALRVLLPLAVLADSPGKLPLAPEYVYAPLNGDSFGFYEAVVDIFVAWRVVVTGWIGLASLAMLLLFATAALVLWRGGVRWPSVLLPSFALSLVLGVVVHDMSAPGAGVIGWPLVWALFLIPLRVVHVSLTPDRAFPAGLAVSLLANAVTIVATALIGVRATGRRSVGLIAAAAYASWPVWVGLVAGSQAWQNGQWNVDVGLHLYAEPVSTALVAVSLAILLRARATATSVAVAGLLLGVATVVKLTNGPIAAALVLALALRSGVRRAVILTLGGLVSAPIIVGFWPKGYVDASTVGGVKLGALYQWRFVSANATTSTIFTPTMLIVLIPLAALGLLVVSGWYPRAVLIAPIPATIVCYAAYYVTNQHPRFYYVILPPLFVLQAAGVSLVWGSLRRGLGQGLPRRRSIAGAETAR